MKRGLIAAIAFAWLLASPVDARTDAATQLALTQALGGDGSGCTAAELHGIVQKADIKTLGTIGSSRVVLASVFGSCLCGNVNCPFVVLRLDGDRNSVLLDSYGYAIAPIGKELPLPNLREVAHDSALISIATVDAYRNGKYVAIDTQRVRGDTGEGKPDSVPVHFVPGSSSAALHGRVSEGWYDQYTFAALPGQRLTISGPDALTYSLSGGPSEQSISLLPGHAVKLPKGGHYRLLVDGDGETIRAYRATITIR